MADQPWLEQESEARISVTFSGEATGRQDQLSLISCGIAQFNQSY